MTATDARSGESWAEVVAAAAPAVATVTAGAASGSGWIALANKVIVTAERALGWNADARVQLEGGIASYARVLSSSARSNVALLLPREPIARPPLSRAAAGSWRTGDRVVCLARPAGRAIAARAATIAEVDRAVRGARRIVLDALLEESFGGGPVLDRSGRVIGVALGGQALVVPIDTFAKELSAVDLPPAQLADLAPTRTCGTCGEAVVAENDRCLSCGASLGAWSDEGAALEDAAVAYGRRVVKDLLSTLGIVANKVRSGPRSWRFLVEPKGVPASHVTLSLGDTGAVLIARAPVVRLPQRGFEAFYRAALTLDDEATGPFRLGLRDDVLVLALAEPTHRLRERDVAALLHDLVREADHWRRVLSETFGAEPAPDE